MRKRREEADCAVSGTVSTRLARRRASITAAAAAALSGCAFLAPPPAVAPLPTTHVERSEARAEALIVLLPGRGDRAQTFFDRGFVQASAGTGYDLIVTDAHLGYYAERTLPQRLREDVVEPARDRGYSQVWLAGISLGGLGSLIYASEFPGTIDGLVMLAPFLGDECLVEDIESAGGLTAWRGESECAEDYEIAAWRWLGNAVSSGATQIVLGYGTEDRMARTYAPLVEALPPHRVHTLRGGHDWETWTELWTRIGEAGLLPGP